MARAARWALSVRPATAPVSAAPIAMAYVERALGEPGTELSRRCAWHGVAVVVTRCHLLPSATTGVEGRSGSAGCRRPEFSAAARLRAADRRESSALREKPARQPEQACQRIAMPAAANSSWRGDRGSRAMFRPGRAPLPRR